MVKVIIENGSDVIKDETAALAEAGALPHPNLSPEVLEKGWKRLAENNLPAMIKACKNMSPGNSD